jgi:hypothetical protein
MDIPFARKVLAEIEADPKRFDMNSWINIHVEDEPPELGPTRRK